MKKVIANIPVTGILHIELEVEDSATKDEIYYAAMDAYCEDESVGELEWQVDKVLCPGNVFKGMLNDFYVTTLKDE